MSPNTAFADQRLNVLYPMLERRQQLLDEIDEIYQDLGSLSELQPFQVDQAYRDAEIVIKDREVQAEEQMVKIRTLMRLGECASLRDGRVMELVNKNYPTGDKRFELVTVYTPCE